MKKGVNMLRPLKQADNKVLNKNDPLASNKSIYICKLKLNL